MNRPRPPIVKPGDQKSPIAPASDAIVLFDGKDLSQWRAEDGSPSKWVVKDGYMESVKGSGYIFSRRTFGDIQLHVEWAAPLPASGSGQGRGNSGVYLMGLYEIQVLDSYNNDTYPDGQAAAVYGQYPPLVNASRPPGEWQSYDIVFRRPRFSSDGDVVAPARVTMLHNGVLVQDSVSLWGPTNWLQHLPYRPHPDRLPISLQDHGNPVRFRNIWVRELPESDEAGPVQSKSEPVQALQPAVLDNYVGQYQSLDAPDIFTVSREGQKLTATFIGDQKLELVAHSLKEFSLRWTAGKLIFDLGNDGRAVGATFYLGGSERKAKRVP
ncbi:MAG: family 16 glycoside hydrolase [Acidobacteriota bacterium]